MNKPIRKKKLIIALVIIAFVIITVLFLVGSYLFAPVSVPKLSKVELNIYRNGSYRELTVSDRASLDTFETMKNGLVGNVSILNSKFLDSERFQKDSQYIAKFCYENGCYQTVEITETVTVVWNYCQSDEYPTYLLYNTSSSQSSEISFVRDGLADYILQMYYETE